MPGIQNPLISGLHAGLALVATLQDLLSMTCGDAHYGTPIIIVVLW